MLDSAASLAKMYGRYTGQVPEAAELPLLLFPSGTVTRPPSVSPPLAERMLQLTRTPYEFSQRALNDSQRSILTEH